MRVALLRDQVAVADRAAAAGAVVDVDRRVVVRNYFFVRLAPDQTFGPGTGFWNIGAALLAPIFDGGTRLHQERGARYAFQQSAEQYRGTVLTAFQNVADTLVALDQDAKALKSTAAAADARRGDAPKDANAHYLYAFALGRYSQKLSIAKALKMGLCPIVCLNKVDRAHADPDRVLNDAFAAILTKINESAQDFASATISSVHG